MDHNPSAPSYIAASSRRNVFLSAPLAVVLAVGVIGVSTLAGSFPLAGGTEGNKASRGEGTLSILATDPPKLPDGVTGVEISYDSISVHSPQVIPGGVWIDLNATGTIDSLALMNVSRTIVSPQVPQRTYDLVRIHISSVEVTYNGSLYGATVANDLLTVAMEGGVLVKGTKPGATLVDLEPTVLNVGSSSSPQFISNTVLQVHLIDPANFSSSMQVIGSMVNLTTTPLILNATALSVPTLNIVQATLGVSSLSVTVKNPGDTTQSIRLVILKPIGVTVAPPVASPDYRLPAFADSIVFAVQADGTLRLISLSQPVLTGSVNVTSIFEGTGFNLLSGSSVTFSYTGTLILGNQTLIPTNYQTTVVSDTAVATFILPLG